MITAQLMSGVTFSATIEERPTMQISMSRGAGGGTPVRLVEIYLPAAGWEGTASPYSQVVEVENATKYSQVNLQPSVEQLVAFHAIDLAFTTENDDGVVTVYAVGDKPADDITMQATVTEVSA